MERNARTLLCLGPPHSGKSVFAFVLFKHLRKLGNDACIMDCDYYSPTYRRIRIAEFAGSSDNEHIYTTPNCRKLHKLTEDNYCRLSQSIYDSIEEEGVIVLDGIGLHTKSTDFLLSLANMLIVLCPSKFKVDVDSKRCCYVREGKPIHPFEFYHGLKNKTVTVTTYYQDEKKVSFDPKGLCGELYNLDRDAILEGNFEKIAKDTIDMILQIASFLLDNWI